MAVVKEKKKFEWTKKKIIAASIIGAAILAFVIFMIIALAMQLGPVRPIKSTDEEAAVVGGICGFDVKYEELRYITLLYRDEAESKYGKYEDLDSAGKAEFEAELKELVFKNIENNYVVLSLCGSLDIDTESRDIEKYVQDQIEEIVEEKFDGSKKLYRQWLSENNITDSFLRFVYRVDSLEALLLEKIVSDKSVVVYGEENILEFIDYVVSGDDYAKTIHAYYPKKSDVIDTSNSKERAEEAVEELAEASGDQERLALMRSVIGRAPFVSGMSITGDGLYFTYGQMGEAYEKAAFELEAYGVSQVVETNDGYYIIMRLPVDEEYVKKNADKLLLQYQYAVLKRIEDAEREKIEFVPNEYFKSLTLAEIE